MRRPVWLLHVFVVGLALHNFVMAELWAAGLRGKGLTVVSAWKEVLLLLALVLVVRARGRLPFDGIATDWLAVAFGAFVVAYAVIPQHWLGGGATHKGILYGLRDDLVPVGAYFLGRGLELTLPEMRRIGRTIVLTAAGVAAFGLVDIYAIPLSWWRSSGAPGWFSQQLGFSYQGLSKLPENFVYNTGNNHPIRRLVSTFLSPLASSYLLVVALLLAAAWWTRARPRGGKMLAIFWGTLALLFAGLLWTHSRSSYLALALGLVAFAVVRRESRIACLGAAVVVVVVGAAFVKAYPHIGPATTFTPGELAVQEREAKGHGPAVSAGGAEDASTASHWRSLKAGIRTVVHHPQGFGLGNSGSTAARTGVTVEAGESTYTQIGVDTGLLGALVFIAWSLALLRWAFRCWVWVGASLVAVLALGLQTDVIGVPWLAYVLWALAGARRLLTRGRFETSLLPKGAQSLAGRTPGFRIVDQHALKPAISSLGSSSSGSSSLRLAQLRHHGSPAVVLPNPTLAPGAINPDVTQANIGKTICVRGWTKTVRPPTSYTNALKLQQLKEYNLPGSPSDYQEDHLISLEMGGSPTDPRNLWPEPYPRAAEVDKIENELNAKICSGELTLAQARKEESTLKHQHG